MSDSNPTPVWLAAPERAETTGPSEQEPPLAEQQEKKKIQANPVQNKPTQTNADVASASQSETLLEVSQVTKSFWLEDHRIDVLQDLTFSLSRSETVAIVGASGAGKSTLLHILGTLDLPTRGDIRILGQDILAMSEDELATFRNRSMGFVFQAHYLLPEFTALENVMMPAFIQRLSKKEAKERADELLNWVGLHERAKHRPGELSGGERQRVALCRALVMRPPLLLADEPTGNLDARTSEGIHRLLLELHQTWDVTPIIVTHNLALAQKMDRKLEIRAGKVHPIEDVETLGIVPKTGSLLSTDGGS